VIYKVPEANAKEIYNTMEKIYKYIEEHVTPQGEALD